MYYYYMRDLNQSLTDARTLQRKSEYKRLFNMDRMFNGHFMFEVFCVGAQDFSLSRNSKMK